MKTQLLFALLILFLPSNLAFHFQSQTAIVQGTVVDYLIPKLYLTDIFILGILLLGGGFRLLRGVNPWLAAFFLITLIRGLLTLHPVSAFWFWLKLLEMSLFVCWLRSQKPYAISYLLHAALPLAVLWQSTLATAQWLRQSSLVGYWFLGEPVFNLTTPGEDVGVRGGAVGGGF